MNVHYLQTHTDPDVAEAMEKIGACNAQITSADTEWKAACAEIILAWWEKELARLTNSSSCASSSRTH